MAGLTFVCPRARPDENGAHDITDAMSVGTEPGFRPIDDRVLYCRRCGQAVRLQDALDAMSADPDGPDRPGGERG